MTDLNTLHQATLPSFVPDDLFDLQFIQGAQLSPDGQQVIYALSSVQRDQDCPADLHQACQRVNLWLLSVATHEARPLTHGSHRNWAARWAPDGRCIAFLSDRTGKPQLHLIAPDGGEARALTRLPEGVSSPPAWSPDGQQLAFIARSTTPQDPEKPYRVTQNTYRFDELGNLQDQCHDVHVISTEGGEARKLTEHRLCSSPGWSADGQQILFVSRFEHDILSADQADLRSVSLSGEERAVLDGWGSVQTAAFTRDGHSVAFVGTPKGRLIGSKSDLWIIPLAGGHPECRTGSLHLGLHGNLQPDMPAMLDNPPELQLHPDGHLAYWGVQDGGSIHPYEIALSGPEHCTPVVAGERACWPLSVSDEFLLLCTSTLHCPTDLSILQLDNARETPLTHLNHDLLGARAQPEVVHLGFPAVDGTPLEGWLLTPPGGSAPHPTVLYIHGGPHSAFGHIFSFDFQMLTGAGYAVLIINQRGSTGYGDAFSTRIIGDWGNLDYQDLMSGVDFAIAQGHTDAQQLGCCGLSGGGNLSCWIVGQTTRFKAAVPENPVTNWTSFFGVSDIPWFAVRQMGGLPHEIPEVYHKSSPLTYAHRCTTPTLLIQGEEDRRCPPEQSEQFYTALKAVGCPVEMVRLPKSAHAGSLKGPLWVRQAQNEALLGWMQRFVTRTPRDDDRRSASAPN
ncbi:S9 family peptidase [Deinococcus peraridilitoris]|uniref:Dipeptidyl aminopeptidase/acylaminoacyl peptidase n=1 Tax=Deinococcus peraridilitoris (strain DSM 19664 / LMG 22246 / CIP 109416 / KR-200) TaxID=937777 RepID=L0A7M2_DEIPD|nr:S9 family peptidase [Deinococcus peraridilitoris]AFZ69449.1 dipeptidyl aminopeptidase/acylaminoacyl peptidase [Deinococcus peraridilitoris DSM 19664]